MSFEIFIIQQSHIDVGYTERQEKIADYQAQFIAQAVKYAHSERQSLRGKDHLFKFTCEGFWAVEQYLRRYGAEGEKNLVSAIKKGYVELTPFYLHLAELLDEGHIRESLKKAFDFAHENGIRMTAAVSSDVNGFSWGMADALADRGVKYLITNINSHHGGAPFGKPLVPFYWESPKGRKILVWSGLAYHKANLLGLMPGLNPSDDPGIPGMAVSDKDGFVDVRDLTLAEKRVFQAVDTLKTQGYPYDFLPIMGSGLYTDNSPVGDAYCELVEKWNNMHADKVHIRTATVEEFFIYLEEKGGEIPTYRGDWNDWWTDGAISTPLEVKLFRNAQRNKRLVEMLDPENRVVSQKRLEDISHRLILYAEHTWGHSSSFINPWKLLVQQLYMRKAKMAIEADELSSMALDDVLRSCGEGEFTCDRPYDYKVINPLKVHKKCAAYLPVDFWEEQSFNGGYRVTDENGSCYQCQGTKTLRGWMVAAEVELEPGEQRVLKLEPWDGENKNDRLKRGNTGFFENDLYKVSWTNEGIKSIISKSTGSELLNGRDTLGMPVYQIFPGGDRRDSAGFGYSSRKKPEYRITEGVAKKVEITEQGPVFTTLKVEYEVPGASCYRVYFTFYSGFGRIAVIVEMTKDIVIDPEGMYTAFPFTINDGKWYLDKPGALMLPGRDQLPGTCCDYYAVSDGAVYSGSVEGVCITTLDAPMVTIGGIKLWNFTTDIKPEGTLFSWLCNNKWETNFKTDCGGFYEFRYTIEFSRQFSNPVKALEAIKQNSYEPLVVRR